MEQIQEKQSCTSRLDSMEVITQVKINKKGMRRKKKELPYIKKKKKPKSADQTSSPNTSAVIN